MERDEFLRLIGTAAVATCAGCALESCSDSSDADPRGAPKPIDFTIDLTLATNAALLTDNGFMYKSGVIIVCLSAAAKTYTAIGQACTHAGSTIVYEPANGNFHCFSHGSRFSISGTVVNGPATRALTKYKTELTGANLRVFS